MYSADILLLFIFILAFSQLLKRYSKFSHIFVLGIRIYLPPLDQDFTQLQQSGKQPRTNRKGQVIKSQRANAKKQRTHIPLRSQIIDQNFAQQVTNYKFQDFQYIQMLACAGTVIPLAALILKLIFPSIEYFTRSNMSFYIGIIALILICLKLISQTLREHENEKNLSLFISLKMFIVSITVLYFIPDILDINLNKSTVSAISRINLILKQMGMVTKHGNLIESFHINLLLAFINALIAFIILRIGVRFAYNFYLFLYADTQNPLKEKSQEIDQEKLNQEQKQKYQEKKELEKRMEKKKMFLNVSSFLFPLCIGSLYIPDLVPEFKGNYRSLFELIRILLGIIFCIFKYILMHKEIQLYFDQTIVYFQVLVNQAKIKQEEFKLVQNRIRVTIHKIWNICSQYLFFYSFIIITGVLQAYNLLWNQRSENQNKQVLNFDQINQKYPNIGDFNHRIRPVVQEIFKKGLFQSCHYSTVLNMVMIAFYFTLTITSGFSLFYYRRYKSAV